ncbi:aa3-type cytochrome c oxidase subunit IV [Sphingomonas oleivorans]|uniref:Aa3-type cytochrome c oxidase subunit IV n=1 Tax=Sphingomonas oleivorans TaxID=1735121 RepID=A0A2T5G039_9SPHN|nr:aa3-type cytochrome c oxidase subunit IV [Sphingomonas oleivorans]PTQ12322.1 aa3-type cytochrome c oxidase subunit IV [Sphingomonas oleivorans]
MAENGAKIELKEHEATYARFLSFFKFGTIACAILVGIVLLLISR